MAWKLAATNFNTGLESQAAQVLGNLKYLSTLTPPVTIASIRTDYETGQPSTFANAGWDNFIQAIGTIELDTSVLTVAERAIYNTLREYISLPPKYGCCETGGAYVTPSAGDGLYSFQDSYRTGSTAPYQYEFKIKASNTYRCDLDTCEIVFTPVGPAPAVTSVSPSVLTSNGCDTTGSREFSYIWLEFGSSPTGQSYNLTLTWKDANGVVIATYAHTSSYTFAT
jgi:hypothetical protein